MSFINFTLAFSRITLPIFQDPWSEIIVLEIIQLILAMWLDILIYLGLAPEERFNLFLWYLSIQYFVVPLWTDLFAVQWANV
jgi:hypothetical protein